MESLDQCGILEKCLCTLCSGKIRLNKGHSEATSPHRDRHSNRPEKVTVRSSKVPLSPEIWVSL